MKYNISYFYQLESFSMSLVRASFIFKLAEQKNRIGNKTWSEWIIENQRIFWA